MYFNDLSKARKQPTTVTRLDIWQHSFTNYDKIYKHDASKISEFIGDLSIFKNLESIQISGVSIPQNVLATLKKNRKLTSIEFSNTGLKTIPEILKEFHGLISLSFQYEIELTKIPTWIDCFTNLTTLNFYGCEALTSLPAEISNLMHLEELIVSDSRSLTYVAASIKKLPKLNEESLEKVEELIQNAALFKQIDTKIAARFTNDTTLHTFFERFENKRCFLNDYHTLNWQGIVFNWYTFKSKFKQSVLHTLSEELLEYPNFIPFAAFSYTFDSLNFNSHEEYFEQVDPSKVEIFLLLDVHSTKVMNIGLTGDQYIELDVLNLVTQS